MLKDSINLIQGYYHFLYMGQYLDQHIKKNDLSQSIKKTTISTGKETTFGFNTKTLESLFASAHKHQDKDNVFGYMVELNAVRGIISTMKELIDNNPMFKRFLQEKISRQYFPFEQIIRLTRNVFAHSYDPKLTIQKENFIHQKTYRSDKGVSKIHFLFRYYDYREERTGDREYGLNIKINFNKLKAGTPLHKAIPRHQLYLFCELCYNLTKLFNASQKKTKKKPKAISKRRITNKKTVPKKKTSSSSQNPTTKTSTKKQKTAKKKTKKAHT